MKLKLCLMLGALSVPAAASAMPVSLFIAKADALQARGVAALFASDYKLLKKTIEADSAALRGERQAAKQGKRTPPYCPPGQVKMSSDDILVAMRAVPEAQRARTDSRDALRAYFARRFPCA